MSTDTPPSPSTTTTPITTQDPDCIDPSIDYKFNDPGLDAIGFLRAVMHEPKCPMSARLRACEILMQVDPERDVIWSDGPTINIPPLKLN